jgi:hypothetical protein
MGEGYRITRILVDHFFRRFFDNDTLQVDGDTQTTVVRALAIVAAPGLMIAFFLQILYPAKPFQRPPWLVIEDHYFFVLFSFVVMGAVSIFEWEMLFPDRIDFLVLSPLSLKPVQMLVAKAAALVTFLMLFLVACNFCGILILPAISRLAFFRQVYAHGVAVLLAGAFAALFFLALGGVLLCLLGAPRFRMASPVLQMLSVMVLVLLLLHCVKYVDSMQALLSGPLGVARWLPPVWFLGLYEHLLHGDAAPMFAKEMARYAVRGTVIAAIVAVVTYPMAWARMRKMAIEGSSRSKWQGWRWLNRIVHSVVRRPGERAVFHFIGQTMARNNRYQVYLAMYCGAGLALAVACATAVTPSGEHIRYALSNRGLHAVMPLLLFWVIAGLRAAFAFPLNLSAGWIFRITGVRTSECAAAARRWTFLCALGAMSGILASLRVAGWDARQLIVQAVVGLCLSVLLTDGFFAFQQTVPFNRPRMPGRTSLPLMLTLYVGVLTPAIVGVILLEMASENHLPKLLWAALPTALAHLAFRALYNGPDEIEEEMEGYEGEFQLLGLS